MYYFHCKMIFLSWFCSFGDAPSTCDVSHQPEECGLDSGARGQRFWCSEEVHLVTQLLMKRNQGFCTGSLQRLTGLTPCTCGNSGFPGEVVSSALLVTSCFSPGSDQGGHILSTACLVSTEARRGLP